MSDVLRAVIVGVVEGLTEFLPISSTGHLILCMWWLGIDAKSPPWPIFLYFVQIGAILAVVVYFAKPLRQQLLCPRPARGWSHHMAVKVGVAMVPGAVAGLSLDSIMEHYLEKPIPVGAALVIGALVMFVIESKYRRVGEALVTDVTLRQALWVGIAQCFAVIPGTSRAMATIMGGMAVGLTPAVAAQFSFYLAIPTLIGAGILRLVKHHSEITENNAVLLAVGFVAAFLSAFLVVAWFMHYIRTRPLKPFAFYRIALGAAVVGWWLWQGR